MVDLRLIKEEDIETLKYEKLDWDVVVHGRPYQVIRAEGFAHCSGGKLDWGEGNCFWAYPLDEEMTYGNLIEFDGVPGARWGIEYSPSHYIKSKWGETEIRSSRKLIITRNDEPFYDGFMTIHDALAMVLDNKLDDHPLNLNFRDFDKKCVGRKVWWRSEPAIIERYINGQACVILKPDGIDRFSCPKEFADDDIMCSEDETVKADIFDKHIWWFRN